MTADPATDERVDDLPDDQDVFDDQDLPAHRPLGLAWLMLVGGAIALVASAALVIEKMLLLANPDYVPSCSFNPVLSCGSVMVTPQASVFGFANPIIGVAGFPAVMMVGAAILAGARLRPWFWIGTQLGVTFGAVFVAWLQFQSIHVIGALCPYCMVVWAVMIPLFCFTTARNLKALAHHRGSTALDIVGDLAWPALVAWVLVLVITIGFRFWYYWSTLL
ncbi:vitamin K epoxide reductase family protein [Aestuariimicrobium soli]|uniref:vitamin K epoxide reductase family protein n=1 Tax=Aestuariimicrobium soli TaxID=2035834 RepID=UPI003EBF4DD0